MREGEKYSKTYFTTYTMFSVKYFTTKHLLVIANIANKSLTCTFFNSIRFLLTNNKSRTFVMPSNLIFL